MDLKKEVSQNSIVLLVIAGENFSKNTEVILKTFSKQKVCYTTINKGVDVLIDTLNKNKIAKENFYFIDAVTKTILEPKKQSNCIFISSPNSLNELSLAIHNCIQKKFPLLVIDSLSTLSIYHSANNLSHFVHHIINEARSEKVSIIFLISDKDKNGDLYGSIEPFMDKVVHLK